MLQVIATQDWSKVSRLPFGILNGILQQTYFQRLVISGKDVVKLILCLSKKSLRGRTLANFSCRIFFRKPSLDSASVAMVFPKCWAAVEADKSGSEVVMVVGTFV